MKLPLVTRESTVKGGRVASGTRVPTYDAFISYSHALDGKLAPALQVALHRFAKRWFALRAVRVFRDNASLSANPGLWGSIETALSHSRYFILLASPAAAVSPWVNQEVAWWLQHKTYQHILIVLTEGEIAWDGSAREFDWARTTCLPPALEGQVDDEPRYIDLRWARTEENVSLNHPVFREAIADLASPLHGVSKDELIGEDVRQHKRVVGIRRAVIASLTCLALVATALAFAALDQRDKATERARVSLSRQLASDSAADRSDNLDRALLLGVEAVRVSPTVQARASLLAALEHDPQLVAYYPGKAVGEIAFSTDGKSMVTAEEGGIVLWDAQRFERVGDPIRCGGDADPYTCGFALSKDGKILALGGRDATVTLWDVSTWRPGRALSLPPPPGGDSQAASDLMGVDELDISASNRFVAAATHVGTSVWDLETGQVLSQGLTPPETENDPRDVQDVRFSPDGSILAALEIDGVQFRDPRTLAPIGARFYGRPFGDLAFTADSRTVAVTDNFGAELWDVTRRQRVGRDMSEPANVYTAAFSPNGNLLVTGGTHGVRFWDVRQQTSLATDQPSGRTVSSVAFTPDGKTVVAGTDGGLLRWDLDRVSRVAEALPAEQEVSNVAFSGDGRLLALGGDKGVILWDARTRTPLPGTFGDATIARASLAMSGDGSILASAHEDGASVWDVRSGRRIGEPLQGVVWGISDVDLDAGGDTVATAGSDGVRLWNARTGAELGPPLRYSESETPTDMSSVAFSPREDLLAGGGDDGAVLWDLSRDDRPGIRLGDEQVRGLAFAPDGRLLATGHRGHVTLWDVPKRRPLRVLPSEAEVDQVTFSPDGETVAASTGDAVTLWDVRSGRVLGTMDAAQFGTGTAAAGHLAFSPDGRTLAYADGKTAVVLIDVSVNSWRDKACQIANRNLTPTEWSDFVGTGVKRVATCPG